MWFTGITCPPESTLPRGTIPATFPIAVGGDVKSPELTGISGMHPVSGAGCTPSPLPPPQEAAMAMVRSSKDNKYQ